MKLRSFKFRSRLLSASLFFTFSVIGCKEEAHQEPESRDPRTHLTPSEANEVLAQVGDTKITLGQYAETLLRLGEYEQMRYQSKERQKLLLEEIVELELLAQEARRRGLDKNPDVRLALDQAKRDEVLALLKERSPAPEEISDAEVKQYFDAHRDEFREPERRRLISFSVASKAQAEQLLQELKSDPSKWGQFAKKHLKDPALLNNTGGEEYFGDHGFTADVSAARGRNTEIAEPLVQALFSLEKLGEIAEAPVEVEGRFYLVKLGALSAARDRNLTSAAPVIRTELARQKFLEAEKNFDKELRQRYPVELIR